MAAAIAKDRAAHIKFGDLDRDAAPADTRSIHVNGEHKGRQQISVACFLCNRAGELFDVIEPIERGRVALKKWKKEQKEASARRKFSTRFTAGIRYEETGPIRDLLWGPGEVGVAVKSLDFVRAEQLLRDAGYLPIEERNPLKQSAEAAA